MQIILLPEKKNSSLCVVCTLENEMVAEGLYKQMFFQANCHIFADIHHLEIGFILPGRKYQELF